jgi:hypothetical protein
MDLYQWHYGAPCLCLPRAREGAGTVPGAARQDFEKLLICSPDKLDAGLIFVALTGDLKRTDREQPMQIEDE